MKNVVAPPLEELEPFIGEWSVEGSHVALPNDQRLYARFSADGNTITGDCEVTDPGAHEMRHEFSVTYTRAT